MINGLVVRGEGVGKELGYPTANLDIEPESVHLSNGVYAAITTFDRKKYESAFIILHEAQKVEVHLIGYKGDDFYGSSLSIEPVQKISEIESFLSEQDLIKKIEEDVVLVKNLFKGRKDI